MHQDMEPILSECVCVCVCRESCIATSINVSLIRFVIVLKSRITREGGGGGAEPSRPLSLGSTP